MSIARNVLAVRRRIADAAKGAARSPADITLVVVTKGADLAEIREAFDAGVTQFGENRLQEAQRKLQDLADLRPRTTWHMVGHLQSNKATTSIQVFDIIQSVDSVRLGELLDQRAERRLPVFLEVNVAQEPSKYGFDPEELPTAFQQLSRCRNLEIRGLMTVAPMVVEPQEARPFFRRLRELAGQLGLRELSMGMSSDFEVAVEEGATLVRIGTAIFSG